MTCDHTRNPIRLEPQNQIPGTYIDYWLWCADRGAIKARDLDWTLPSARPAGKSLGGLTIPPRSHLLGC